MSSSSSNTEVTLRRDQSRDSPVTVGQRSDARYAERAAAQRRSSTMEERLIARAGRQVWSHAARRGGWLTVPEHPCRPSRLAIREKLAGTARLGGGRVPHSETAGCCSDGLPARRGQPAHCGVIPRSLPSGQCLPVQRPAVCTVCRTGRVTPVSVAGEDRRNWRRAGVTHGYQI